MHITLISLPWAIFNRPSIQLGSLKAYLTSRGNNITVDTLHPYLEIAAEIGFDRYRILSQNSWAAEALYCSLLFPEQDQQAGKLYRRSLGRSGAGFPDFKELANLLDSQLDRWLDHHDFSRCSLAGFSICFSQLPASLLAAGRLKERYPGLPVVFGGSTCTPDLAHSLLKVFPQVDFIITGEGEQSLLSLCDFTAGRTTHPVNVICRQNFEVEKSGEDSLFRRAPGNQLLIEALPYPDYDDYFTELRGGGHNFIPALPVEFSRGCWWNKCTFCNLNLQWCGYRHKKSGRMVREIEYLTQQHRCLDFFFTDNSLPPAEAAEFFRLIRSQQYDFRFFGEIRPPNKVNDYAVYAGGGLRSVQIGIEALSDSLLDKMNKGMTVMDNVAAMRHCAEAGISLEGNLILEFPRSTQEEVEETLFALDHLLPYHPLQPAAFFLGHGSPICDNPRDYGIRSVGSHPNYRQLYPPAILAELTMIIQQGRGDRERQTALWQPVRRKIRHWQEFHDRRKDPRNPLTYRQGDNFIIIRQERPGTQVFHHRLHGLSMQIYLACRYPVSMDDLLQQFPSVTKQQLEKFAADLQAKYLMFGSGGKLLSLAIRWQSEIS